MTREEAQAIYDEWVRAGHSYVRLGERLGITKAGAHYKMQRVFKLLGIDPEPFRRGRVKQRYARAIAENVMAVNIGPWLSKIDERGKRYVMELTERARLRRVCAYLPDEIGDEEVREALRALLDKHGFTQEKIEERFG